MEISLILYAIVATIHLIGFLSSEVGFFYSLFCALLWPFVWIWYIIERLFMSEK